MDRIAPAVLLVAALAACAAPWSLDHPPARLEGFAGAGRRFSTDSARAQAQALSAQGQDGPAQTVSRWLGEAWERADTTASSSSFLAPGLVGVDDRAGHPPR